MMCHIQSHSNKKRQFIIAFIFFCGISMVFAQEYEKAVGLRGGLTSGITYKKFLNDIKAMEAIISFRDNGLQVTALREYHQISFLEYGDGFYFIQGYGGHLGFLFADEFNFLFTTVEYQEKRFSPVLGIDGYIGIEYRVQDIPVIGGIDYKPFMEFSLRNPFRLVSWDFAFYIKYTF